MLVSVCLVTLLKQNSTKNTFQVMFRILSGQLFNKTPPLIKGLLIVLPLFSRLTVKKILFPRVHIRNISPPGRDLFWQDC